jgi:predicted butyrate kinase (DUF1464 family)
MTRTVTLSLRGDHQTDRAIQGGALLANHCRGGKKKYQLIHVKARRAQGV